MPRYPCFYGMIHVFVLQSTCIFCRVFSVALLISWNIVSRRPRVRQVTEWCDMCRRLCIKYILTSRVLNTGIGNHLGHVTANSVLIMYSAVLMRCSPYSPKPTYINLSDNLSRFRLDPPLPRSKLMPTIKIIRDLKPTSQRIRQLKPRKRTQPSSLANRNKLRLLGNSLINSIRPY